MAPEGWSAREIRPFILKIKQQKPDTVTHWKYLGAIGSDDWLKPEVFFRDFTAALTKMNPIWRDNNICFGSKMILMQSFVTSIFQYASEAWAKENEQKEKKNAGLWYEVLRRSLNILYEDHITHEEVRRKIQAAIGAFDKLLTMVKKPIN